MVDEVDQKISAKKKIIHIMIDAASLIESEENIDAAIERLNLLFHSPSE